MKIKKVALAVLTGLVSMGTLQAAIMNHQNSDVLQAPNFTFADVQALTLQLQEHALETGDAQQGVNRQIKRPHKFIAEGISGAHVYIVRLNDQPVAMAMAGELAVQRARHNSSKKLFTRGVAASEKVNAYRQSLLQKQQAVIAQIASVTGQHQVRRQFTKALNGFSLTLTEAQAEQVAGLANVVSVVRAKNYELLSDQGPKTIHAEQVWLGQASSAGLKAKGEGQIIGIIDTGINSDHPAFADEGEDGYNHINPWGAGVYVGDCVEDAAHIQCNDKLIGVRSYDVITDTYHDMRPGWPAIGEDYQGHGSHVASTAAGNVLKDVPYMVAGAGEESDGHIIKDKLFPELSGVAPHANIVSYQVCYPSNDSGFNGCPAEALVAGIEDAIDDGVDVINFSIGGADSNIWADPVQLAFLSAREAGINIAAAAGNSGSGNCGQECFGYLDNASPWLAQVAATTHAREVLVATPVEFAGFVEPALGQEIPSWAQTGLRGEAINQAEITGVVVWAKDYKDANGIVDGEGYCATEFAPNTFNFFKNGTAIPGAATGDTKVIVVCQRHAPNDPNANARTAKIDNIKAGGAAGFIMFNRVKDQSTVPESYELPGVHFTNEQWNGVNGQDGLEDWVDSTTELGHMITIKPTQITREINQERADWLATFSSRGPSYANVEVLAPTVSAPGVNIYAAYADEHPFTAPHGADFSALSGTSMASPHVAGAMALLRQLQPDWSAAEIQSALAMTTDNEVRYRRLNLPSGDVGEAGIYRAGTGRINVENAAQAGLVMHETADNFLAADPYNGGTPHKLNIPNLVNFSCAPECQWVRTVKATKDGTWSVSHEDVINWAFDMRTQSAQNGVNIEVIPNTFSLKKGETQTIVIKASIMDTQDWFSNSEVELHTNLIFKAEEADIPEAHWPLVFKYDRGDLPSNLVVSAHTDDGSYKVKNVQMPATESPTSRVYKATKADIKTITLPKDDDGTFPWALNRTTEVDMNEVIDEAVHFEFITVPANAKRLVAEVQGVVESSQKGSLNLGNPLVYVGKDYNDDGVIQPQDEILCVSNHIIYNNFCNINNPEEGKYWVMLYNSKKINLEGVKETFTYATAMVTDETTNDIQVALPAADGKNKVDMDITWQMPMDVDSVYYSLIDVGTSEANTGNVGAIPLKVIRGKNHVSLDVPQTKAKVGQAIPLTFEVLANNSGMDRTFSFTATIPEGLTVTPERIFHSSQADLAISVAGNQLKIEGVQADTSDVKPDYLVTTNADDEMCRLPSFGNSNPGGYVNLSEFGILPMLSGFDDKNQINYRDGWAIPISSMFNGQYKEFSLFNNTAEMNAPRNIMQVRGNGIVDFTGAPLFYAYHFRFPYNSFPYESLAPLWRGISIGGDVEIMSLGLSAAEGISLASTATGWGIVEWDNARDYGNPVLDRTSGKYEWEARDNQFDFEILFNVNTRFGKGEHEIYYAYDNINYGSTDARGSIGLQGFKGQVYSHGPLSNYIGKDIAFENLNTQVQSGNIICMDYIGPESSQFEVTVWADVNKKAPGRTMMVTAKAAMTGMADTVMNHAIEVPSHITVVELDDMTTQEEHALSFTVTHIDEQTSANEIVVTGEHINAMVDGDLVTITPAADFVGDTLVTVVVRDIEHPNDAARTSFTLTVTNVNDAPTIDVAQSAQSVTEGGKVTLDASASFDVDGDPLSFSWTGPGNIATPTAATTTVSELMVGEHTFTLELSDGDKVTSMDVKVTVSAKETVVTPQPESQKSSSGSLGWLVIIASLLGMRRFLPKH
ncbi:S8 family serine peptidase [Pseudoalteromonas fenneropenaei]|uniref:S8 family serine peptidase n=1 Tax=Pseudoalteromonas fenneropenaei TaxID=1737459 RepID=A0ABV7CCA8_9GAMM